MHKPFLSLVLPLILTALFMAGCTPSYDHEVVSVRGTEDPAVKQKKVTAWYSNYTHVSYSRGHGTQVSYHAPGGRVYLWYPGNRVVLSGRWKTEIEKVVRPRGGGLSEAQRTYTKINICYKYGPNTYNPVTGNKGGRWNCWPAVIDRRAYTSDTRKGDVFGLSRRTQPPFVLSRDKTSISKLLKKI